MSKVAGTLRVPSAGCRVGQAKRRPTNPPVWPWSRRTSYEKAATNRRTPKGRGTAMIVVLLAMAMATIIFLATLKMIAVQRKTIALGARQIQAGWLADSGVERAAARLAADANYRGETWNISPEDLDGRDGGTVAIRVEDIPGKPGRRAVHVEADFPPDPQQRAREVRDVIIRTGTQP